MNSIKKYTFECITPCFCAGEDQAVREIRPASIRGSLRWWFRALGGSRALESECFGGADPITASALQIRVSAINPKPVGHLPKVRGSDPLSYILYFPSVAADEKRWNPEACYGQGTTFDLHIRQLRTLSETAQAKLNEAITVFRHYGSIGMHITRGLGAIQDKSLSDDSWKASENIIETRGFVLRKSNRTHNMWDTVLKEAGQWLQGDMRKEFGAGGNKKPRQSTALGAASPSKKSAVPRQTSAVPRQTSAVYLRPIKREGKLRFAAFEAPHARVLGDVSIRKHREPILQSRDFTKEPPSPQGNSGRRGPRR